jgi:hypothetical protein
MRDTKKSVVTLAGAGALAALLATSAFAQNTTTDAQSHGNWQNGRQRAAASNEGARNHAQSGQAAQAAPQPQSAQLRQNGRQGQQPAAQFRPNTPQVQQGTAQVRAEQSNRGFQNGRSNDTNRNVSQADRSGNWNAGGRESARVTSAQSYRNNERVTLSGRVTSFTHENGGYRVHLDRDGRSFWIPESRFRNHSALRVGLSISLGGIFNGGLINVDALSYPGEYGYGQVYDQGYVRGVVDRVDYRTNTILVRDEASGRFINVDMRTAGQTSGVDARNVRPGDYLTLSGQWDRGGVFEAYRVDNVSPRPY